MNESPIRGPFTILLVEDNIGDYLLMKEARVDSPFKVDYHLVSDGLECLDFLHRRGKFAGSPTPDLIILDLSLERMDGLDVLKEVKGDERLKAIPVMVFTGSNSPSEIREAYQAGANCYVTKPIGLGQLERAIRLIEEFWLGLVRLPGTKP